MNILIPDSWLREFLETKATPLEIQKYLSLCGPSVEKIDEVKNDFIYNIEITTNRIDTVSVEGIAREAAAILPRFGIAAAYKEKSLPPILGDNRLNLEIRDPQKLCERIVGLVMDKVTVEKSNPEMAERLEKCGVRALNNVIDITNYVMLESGHPCHVFDYDRVKTSKLFIRFAQKGERITTLDGKKFTLDNEDVVIDDGSGRLIDLPGIMGCENSVVTDKTRRIIVFIESNNPLRIRKTSMKLGIRTFAAAINEKKPDSETAFRTFQRAVELYQKNCQAEPASLLLDIYPGKKVIKPISVSPKNITGMIGIDIQSQDIISILESLKFKVAKDHDRLSVTAPFFRAHDVGNAHDIVEEVARIYGFHRLPGRMLTGQIPASSYPRELTIASNIKKALKYWGFYETYHYSLISKDLITKSELKIGDHLKLSNPLTEELAFLRTSLVPSMLTSVKENEAFGQNVSFFELANIYLRKKDDLPTESEMLLLATQKDFFQLKGIITALLNELAINDVTEDAAVTHHFWHPKQSLIIKFKNIELCILGRLHPTISQNFNLGKTLFLAELSLSNLTKFASYSNSYRGIPKYPSIIEKITFSLTRQVKLGNLIKEIIKSDKEIIMASPVDKFKDWLTLEVHYRSQTKNLSQNEVAAVRQKIIDLIEKKYRLEIKR